MAIFDEIKKRVKDDRVLRPQKPVARGKSNEQTSENNAIPNSDYYSLCNLFWYVDIVDDKPVVKMLYSVPQNLFSQYLLFRPKYFENDKKDYSVNFDFYDVDSNQLVNVVGREDKLYKFCDLNGCCTINNHRIDYKDTSLNLQPKGYYKKNFSTRTLEMYGYAVTDFYRPVYVFDPSMKVSGYVKVYLSGSGSFRYSYIGKREEYERALRCICFDKKMINNIEAETAKNLSRQIEQYNLKDKVNIR